MSKINPSNKFSKVLEYALGRKPDEFGLIPDEEGYVKIKDLLKTFNEEEGWRHIRMGHIQEVMAKEVPCPIEVKENLIRAVLRDQLPIPQQCDSPPKLLYGWVRKKAYPFVFRNGLSPSACPFVPLARDKEFAERMGKRIDQEPVILTVMVRNCLDNGLSFQEFGDLFLTGFIPVDCFTGPPLPKEREEVHHKEKTREKQPLHAGSFFLEIEKAMEVDKPYKNKKKKSEPDWKKDRARVRREKERY